MQILPENTYAADPALRSLLGAWLTPEAMAFAEPRLQEMGRAAAHELSEWGRECERQPAWLRTIEPWGERVDEVVYSEAWRRLGEVATRSGLTNLPYSPEALQACGPDLRVVHLALCYLFEPGTATYSCPVAMTDAAARVLHEFGPDELRDQVLPRLISTDPAEAWTAGQWMTEQQGGSDVGANQVEARRDGGGWRLYGRKFFCSNVGGEVVLALARAPGDTAGTRGLGLFLIPRLLPDGKRNQYRIDRLKEKLGTRAMATGEVTLEGAVAYQVGELDRGFAQMTPMLNITRLHNATASAAAMRRGLQLAREFARRRSAFGRRLEDQPLQRQVLVDMAVKAEAVLLLTMRMARLLGRVENGHADEQERLLFRVGTSLVKLYTAKLAVAYASEAIEAFGGQGYMEDTGIPRLLRDAQVLPIWEGTTNVLSLDTLRVLAKNPDVAEAYADELARLGSPRRVQIMDLLGKVGGMEPDVAQRWARRLAHQMADAWTDGLLREAAGSGGRQALVADRWERGAEPPDGSDDGFAEIVDGAGVVQPVA
ncbi:MAG TPA: acyl-CoA dehydrogenase family protein [Candidatus Dormibacteraeota bacterium]